jgi:hypothetical protein
MLNLLISLYISLGVASATTFKIQPIEQQVKESDGVFQGHYLRSKTVELEDGSLATQMMFKMSKEVGLQSDFYGMDEVIVHYPGGKTAEREVRVEGVPEFVSGEKVVLFISSVDNRYWGMNLAFGTYKVINYGKEVMMVNSVFPEDPKVGQINFQQFEKIVKEIKGTSLKVVQTMQIPDASEKVENQRSPASVTEGQNRTVASVSDQSDNHGEQPSLPIFWLIVALGITGGIFRLNNRRAQK